MIYEALRRKFSPEFLNRLDDIIVFKKLSREDCGKIAEILVEKLKRRLKESKEIELRVLASALDKIIDFGYDEEYGARPLRRAIQKYFENMLSEEIISGRIKGGDVVSLYAEYDEIKYVRN